MDTVIELSPIELQRKGIEILTKDLGIAGAIQFIKLFDKGSGDWTKDRKRNISDLSVDEITSEIIANRNI